VLLLACVLSSAVYAGAGSFPDDVLVVATQCHEDVAWLHAALPPKQVVTCAKLSCLRDDGRLENASYDARCSQESRAGFEVASFLRFIVTRLEANETLPEWLAFLHGHRVAWHHGASAGVLSQIRRSRRDAFSFINVRRRQLVHYAYISAAKAARH
jgi:hypothetical protein